jgi:hypothetical protein
MDSTRMQHGHGLTSPGGSCDIIEYRRRTRTPGCAPTAHRVMPHHPPLPPPSITRPQALPKLHLSRSGAEGALATPTCKCKVQSPSRVHCCFYATSIPPRCRRAAAALPPRCRRAAAALPSQAHGCAHTVAGRGGEEEREGSIGHDLRTISSLDLPGLRPLVSSLELDGSVLVHTLLEELQLAAGVLDGHLGWG